MSNRTCTVHGCDKPYLAKGMCQMHYTRVRRGKEAGDARELRDIPLPEKLYSRVEAIGDCLIWRGHVNPKGYGKTKLRGQSAYAHRVAWELRYGPIPEGMVIDHTCWNPGCINIAHLRIATVGQNSSNRNGPHLERTRTGVRNVYPNGYGYQVAIRHEGRMNYFGTYSTLAEAAEVADESRDKLFGKFAGRGGPRGSSTPRREVAPRAA